MSPIFYASVILLFVAVVLAMEGAYIWWNSRHGPLARRLESRIRTISAGALASSERLSILKQRQLGDATPLERALKLLPRVQGIDRFLQQAGMQWSVAGLVTTCAVIPPLVFSLAMFSSAPLPVIAMLALLSASLPVLYVRRRRAKRLRQLERQLPEACDMLARALRAGHAFSLAIDMVGTEFAEPMGGEFRTTFDEINYGVSLNEALANLAKRVPIRDLRYFVIAVLIQRETGGNLAEVLDGITALIRERFKLFDKVRVLSAEGRLSAWVLGLLPFIVGTLMLFLNPGFLEVLWKDPMGLKMTVAALSSMAAGVLWMSRVVALRV
ncbi:tight adherence protein B [Paraburkholderia bannensis]|uniref:Tight adherence protein B n=1 Tax=Paraburkholderia bannensis TaxID=765414 RepID=A0A7W9U0T0_9BURK|nr:MULTISPECIES: type II secretion system F family protein [Paraburkholderia]MBB3259136.1 tight adherence protein B [Paraburkholderia sp. WP4_3_2]MBB6104151.1 tight adherence protein B [Paraburkholderia bannensis]